MIKYTSANKYFVSRFGEKVYKIALDGGMNCPNRTADKKGGCIFCSDGGSGEFAEKPCGNVSAQIEKAILRVIAKKPTKFIAYFQSYTNTFAPVSYLEKIFFEAISHPLVVALSIATRPDCLGDDVLALLSRLNGIKPVFVELGLQTSNDETAKLINRGYDGHVYLEAVKNLKQIGVNVITHIILGLPGETENDALSSVRFALDAGTDGIKLQLLHVLKNTPLEKTYLSGAYTPLEKEQYFSLVAKCLAIIPQNIVVHRITGDPPKKILVAPLWCADKKAVLNGMNNYLKTATVN